MIQRHRIAEVINREPTSPWRPPSVYSVVRPGCANYENGQKPRSSNGATTTERVIDRCRRPSRQIRTQPYIEPINATTAEALGCRRRSGPARAAVTGYSVRPRSRRRCRRRDPHIKSGGQCLEEHTQAGREHRPGVPIYGRLVTRDRGLVPAVGCGYSEQGHRDFEVNRCGAGRQSELQ